mmetsp:Transcript_17991/g.44780  ORF Transcript_17991/g.44780 Transcript_17991/m.44780 type:complete len:593 (+) Transcript_17991:96-1874(+)|eukprot:CAMPEP_0116100314 /NCGR_PEP_ID=MMETSP0327-20121206/12228_1 /TAXON_ID=44447 /ORGANISM="Pseudo-nitzschia delicatissima, Strain B596" /LENGTH=592 /DNA_ID=CAMNT_0003592235 /DNA_START=41 /DNA_END=1819 /DNA_ORIENTATION=-
MGGFKKIFKKMEQNAEKLLQGETVDTEALPDFREDSEDEDYELTLDHSTNPTRWEKAVVGMHGMVKQVSKVDPDGLDIVCFGGTETGKISVYRQVKNVKDVERMVTSKLPSGPCKMGKAMDFVLQEAFEKGFKKRPCGILVLTAGRPDDAERLEESLKQAAERIARAGYKESPLSVTFVHVGDDDEAEDYMQHLNNNMVSEQKSKKTGEQVDIVDSIKDRDIQAAMKEIKGTKSTGTTGAIIGAFAGAAMGVGGMYLYNKHQAKKRTRGWNGKWKATYDGFELATLEVEDNMKGQLVITGFAGGKTTGKYVESKKGYNITFLDSDEHWRITGDIEDEHTIFWSDGTRWDEIPPKGGKWTHYAGAAAAGAATGGAVGYLLDKKFFKKCSKKDQCDYVIMVDRSAMMAVVDKNTMGSDSDDEDGIEEYQPDQNSQGFIQSTTNKFQNLSTGEKVAVGVAGAAAVAGVAAAGVGIAKAVKSSKDDTTPVATARAIDTATTTPLYKGGFNGKWRSTFDGDTLAVLSVEDDLKGKLVISGFLGGDTMGSYIRRGSNQQIASIQFIDADENWAVKGEVKGSKETVVIWGDGTRWDKIA